MVICDSYSETNQSNDYTLGDNILAMGQSFTGDGGVLNSCKWYLKKTGTISGNIQATIYAHTGTYGSGGTPTGSVLATSDNFDVSVITTSYQLCLFDFSGAEKITLANGTRYVLVIEAGFTTPNVLRFGIDKTSPTHPGNGTYKRSTGWTADSGDFCFYIYTEDRVIGPFPTHFRI